MRRLPLKNEEHLNDARKLTYFIYHGFPALTNAKPDQIKEGIDVKGVFEVTISHDSTTFHASDEHFLKYAMQMTGFKLYGDEDKSQRADAKFVFMKNGIFFLAFNSIPHIDVIRAIGCYDRVAVYSAGFIELRPTGVRLFGESVSLDRKPLRFECTDCEEISNHLGIPYAVEETI